MIVFTFLRLIFIIVSIIGMSMILPLAVAIFCGEYQVIASFLIPMMSAIAAGIAFYFAGKNKKISLSTRNVFALVVLSWIAISLFGSTPLLISGTASSVVDAVFESVSGFTTSGVTVLSGLDKLPRSINLWRCQTHWLGGMGVIALTIALLPLLGTGGFQLIKAESSGPEKGKITPKMANTAKSLWMIYAAITLAETISLMICGMDLIDGITYSFSTLGTGGFATNDSSVGGYNSAAIDIVCTIFMFLGGVNFSLYFYVISGKFDEVRKNSELKGYLIVIALAVLCVSVSLIRFYGSFAKALRYGAFHVAAIITTTGFSTADYLTWPATAQFFIFILFFIGSCSGSTSGGFKIIRWVVLGKQAKNEMMRMIHPHGVFSVRINGRAGRKDLVFNVAAFTFVYFFMVMVTTLIGTICKLDVFTSFSMSLSMASNTGPAFGALGPSANCALLKPALKLWYCFVMIAGRLEMFNILILFIPDYWKK